MKKVIILTNTFNLGGTEVALNSLLEHMDPDQFAVTICCITKTGPLLDKVPDWVKVQEVEFRHPMYRVFVSGMKEKTDSLRMLTYKVIKKLYYWFYSQTEAENRLYHKLLKQSIPMEEDYDILLDFHGYGYFLTAYGIKGIKATKKAMWLHDENISWVFKVGEYLPGFHRFFCVSQAVKKSFIQTYPKYEAKTEVFYNMTNINGIREKSLYSVEGFGSENIVKLLTVGRLEHQKGYDIAIETARILVTRGLKFKWFVIGDGMDHAALLSSVKKYSLENHVIFLGRKANPFPYMRECQIYIQPSRHEGYATTILEAKVLGKAIVASDIPSNREQLIHGENGYLEELNPEKFAKRIEMLITNPSLIREVEKRLESERLDFEGEIVKLDSLLT